MLPPTLKNALMKSNRTWLFYSLNTSETNVPCVCFGQMWTSAAPYQACVTVAGAWTRWAATPVCAPLVWCPRLTRPAASVSCLQLPFFSWTKRAQQTVQHCLCLNVPIKGISVGVWEIFLWTVSSEGSAVEKRPSTEPWNLKLSPISFTIWAEVCSTAKTNRPNPLCSQLSSSVLPRFDKWQDGPAAGFSIWMAKGAFLQYLFDTSVQYFSVAVK